MTLGHVKLQLETCDTRFRIFPIRSVGLVHRLLVQGEKRTPVTSFVQRGVSGQTNLFRRIRIECLNQRAVWAATDAEVDLDDVRRQRCPRSSGRRENNLRPSCVYGGCQNFLSAGNIDERIAFVGAR